ncbi:uncharacterized protein cubi_03677 [Cryptosporidium ubiquitum]|uniref:Uncharacterized protein n=1 Tax=Cryptosporidium ubiquitum TaxID=857276 RepID=A0A1J4MFM8_9CRYT|nr:uncharacterized protein cubi_03677 [Cryptosporidium ubiquitum]OII72807.1 hypothetical protein cubi_03677 [Cryptosporidium ubiquitum]
MTKKDARNSLRASIETTSSSVLGSGENINNNSPNSKRKCVKKEFNDTEANVIESYKKKLDEHKDLLHESMTKFLNSLYDELENSRVNLEASCVRSLQRYGDSIKKLESLKSQNMESSLKLKKMQNMFQKFSDKITQV